MATTRLIVFLLVSFLGFGCSSSYRADSEHIHLITTGPVLLNVDAFAGDVILHEIENHVGTSIEIRCTVATPMQLTSDSILVQISAFIERHTFGEEVIVKVFDTEQPYLKKHTQIIVTTSVFSGVQISTSKGNIDVPCNAIPLNIRTSDGDVYIAITDPMTENISVTNKRGDIYLNILPDSSGIVDATAIGGESILNARAGHSNLLIGTTKEHLLATINEGDNVFSLNTVDGNVYIKVTDNPQNGWSWSLDDWLPF
jgi:hypothetical protein